ncbi:MAG: SLBB domain-containing protein [Candidatus Celaenobacter antarcticus]|nr:SLBB domain-containing protein [Candidatus Celaenobacter antarcticus]
MRKHIFIVILIMLLPVILVAQSKMDLTQSSYQMIQYSVSVVGNVRYPGTYRLQADQRVFDAIKRANTFIDENGNLHFSPPENSSTRNITLKNKNGVSYIDIERFLRLGDEKHNPYIHDGDIIIVPAIEENIIISGAVNNPGELELLKNDRILDIVMLSMGLSNNAYLDSIEVVRFIDNSSNTEMIFVNFNDILNNPDNEQNILLKNDDRVFVRSIPEYHRKEGVVITGEVEFPGGYAIENGKTTLHEVLVESGGPTEKADLRNAYLQRRSSEDVVDPEYERLKMMLVEDMTPLEYEYFKTKSREMRGKFATDFQKLWFENDPEFNFLLKTGDYIYIPDKTVTVTISGQVKNPGLVTYVEGNNYLYYVDKAGGFAWRARKGKIRLIKANTGEWLKPNENTPVEVGDMVFIPEKPEIDYWVLTKDIMTIAAQIATVIIVIQNVAK